MNLPVVDGSEDRILSGNLGVDERMLDRRRAAEHDAVGVNSFPGDAIEALGDVGSLDLERFDFPRLHIERDAARSKTILRIFVAVAAQGEEDLVVHQRGVVDGDQTGAVGDEAHVTGRSQLDEGDAAVGLLIHHLDSEVGR
jgi:hypothetical protein